MAMTTTIRTATTIHMATTIEFDTAKEKIEKVKQF